MIVVAGSLRVDAEARDGCLDFALSPDLLEPDRINVFERWESASALEAFRGSGPPGDQLAELREIRVTEYEVRKADQ